MAQPCSPCFDGQTCWNGAETLAPAPCSTASLCLQASHMCFTHTHSRKWCDYSRARSEKVSRRFEPRSLDSGSRVLAVTPRGHPCELRWGASTSIDTLLDSSACAPSQGSPRCPPLCSRPRADLNRDRWIQGPECWPLHHEADLPDMKSTKAHVA